MFQSKSDQPSFRLWEVDALRGFALLGMVMHHWLFLISWRGLWTAPWVDGLLSPLGVVVRTSFIVLVGVSSWLWFLRWRGDTDAIDPQKSPVQLSKGEQLEVLFRRAGRRGLPVIAGAILVTVMTYSYLPASPVQFGVLHMIGISSLLVVPFLFYPRASLAWGILIWLFGSIWPYLLFGLPGLIWPASLYWLIQPSQLWPMLDYFPLVPWFGLVLIGVWIGFKVYGSGGRSPFFESRPPQVVVTPLAWLGRHALILYIVHLPLLVFLSDLIY